MPVQDTSMPAPSATEPFVDRYRRVTPKWYPWVKRMIDSLRQTVLTVNTIETQVGTIDVTVDQLVTDLNSAELTIASLEDTTVAQGIQIANTITLTSSMSAQWAVTVNGNNQVIGQVKLDGSATNSTFSVVADKFVVAHPAAPGTTITAFVVGNVDGIPTVGINGNLVVDDTILARHISVSSLDAISASFGNATFSDSAKSVATVSGQPALTIDFSTPRIRMLSAV